MQCALPGGEPVDYSVKIFTGSMRSAGTDAHVSLELIGQDGASTGPKELPSGPKVVLTARCPQ